MWRPLPTLLAAALCLLAPHFLAAAPLNSLPNSPRFSAIYDEQLAKRLIRFSAATYADDPTICIGQLAAAEENWRLINSAAAVNCSRLAHNECVVGVFRSEPLRIQLFAFRGTVGLPQFLAEALSLPMKKHGDLGNVNQYFGEAFEAFWSADSR